MSGKSLAKSSEGAAPSFASSSLLLVRAAVRFPSDSANFYSSSAWITFCSATIFSLSSKLHVLCLNLCQLFWTSASSAAGAPFESLSWIFSLETSDSRLPFLWVGGKYKAKAQHLFLTCYSNHCDLVQNMSHVELLAAWKGIVMMQNTLRDLQSLFSYNRPS